MNLDKFSNDNDLEIDLTNLKLVIKKYTGIILVSTFIASFIGYLRAKSLPKVWQGQFQIVLGDKKVNSSSDIESNLRSLLGQKNKSSDLSTQLEIMKSPLILIPAYENIINSEEFKELNIKEFSFGEIKSNLKSKFKDGTTVLKITYNNSNKELIPIVLNEISKTYQVFSYRDVEENLDKGINYLNQQILLYDKKLNNSTRELKEFSKKYDLSFKVSGEEILINTEELQLKSREDIRVVNKRISLLQSLKNKDEFIYIAKIYNPNSDILNRIKNVENQIVVNQTLYQNEDQVLNLLNRRRDDLYESLRLDLISFLRAEKKALQAEENSSERPIDVLAEYSRLIRKNMRNNKLLTRLEKNKNEIMLELAKTKDPWEIITQPQVLDYPIGPDQKKVLLIYSFFGFFGTFISFLIFEIRKGQVLSTSECEKVLGIPKLIDLPSAKGTKYWEESLYLLFSSFLEYKDNEKVVLYYLGNKDEELFKKLSLCIESLFGKNYLITNDFLEVKNYKKQILVIQLGTISKKELKDFAPKIKLQKKEIPGFIVLNNINL